MAFSTGELEVVVSASTEVMVASIELVTSGSTEELVALSNTADELMIVLSASEDVLELSIPSAELVGVGRDVVCVSSVELTMDALVMVLPKSVALTVSRAVLVA